MDHDLKQKWLNALRSGEYKQGTYTLRTKDDHYCCLGVLCDVSGAGEWCDRESFSYLYKVGESQDSTTLPPVLANSLGFDKEKREALILLNDREEMTFAEIADYIEANL